MARGDGVGEGDCVHVAQFARYGHRREHVFAGGDLLGEHDVAAQVPECVGDRHGDFGGGHDGCGACVAHEVVEIRDGRGGVAHGDDSADPQRGKERPREGGGVVQNGEHPLLALYSDTDEVCRKRARVLRNVAVAVPLRAEHDGGLVVQSVRSESDASFWLYAVEQVIVGEVEVFGRIEHGGIAVGRIVCSSGPHAPGGARVTLVVCRVRVNVRWRRPRRR